MKKVIATIAIIVLVIVAFIIYERVNRGTANNDGIAGVITFEKLTSDTGYGIDIDQGEFPIDINLTKGKLNIKISKGDNVVFEENDIVESKNEVISIPEGGNYIFTISGKKATGTIKYPVTENAYTPDIVKEASLSDEAENKIYVGSDSNFKAFEVEVDENLSAEEKVETLIEQISKKIGYKIIINEINFENDNITIDLDSKSAPFDVENTYIGNGEEEYHTYAVDETTATIFDSIIKTLQSHFGSKMNVYIHENGKEVAKSDSIEETIKSATKKYFEMVYEDKIEDIKIDSIKIYEKKEVQDHVDLAENDYAFEIEVELKPTNKDEAEKITDALGEYNEETGWVVEKEGFGVMRYNVITNEYDVTSITRK